MSIPGPDEIKRFELTNGITLLVRENHASPSVVVSGYLEVGARDETDPQAGLASFTASALGRGTENRTFDEIYEAVEAVGASFGVSSGRNYTGFGGKSLAEDLPLVLDILSDVLRQPTLPHQEVEKLRGEILTDIEERTHNTRRMAGLTFNSLAYPKGHPYGRSVAGYPETISALTRDDLLDFYRTNYGPDGMVVSIVGGIAPERALAQFEAAFGDWEGRTPPRGPLPAAPPPEEIRREVVIIPGKSQSDIVLGAPGPPRSDPQFLDAYLCNTILGVFGMMGRLGKNVREERGLAYYSYSRISGGSGPGPWIVVAGVDPANVEQAVEAIRAEIRRMREEPVPTDELEDSQTYLVGSLPLRLERNEGVAFAALDMERFGLGLDYLQRYGDLIRAITAEQVQEAAQRWLDPDAFNLVVAGPPRDAQTETVEE